MSPLRFDLNLVDALQFQHPRFDSELGLVPVQIVTCSYCVCLGFFFFYYDHKQHKALNGDKWLN